jgi:hypothetical protein
VRATIKSRKHWRQVFHAEMLGQKLADHGAKVRRQHQIATYTQLVPFKPRPLAIDTAALDLAAQHKHAIRAAVVCAAISVPKMRLKVLLDGGAAAVV